MRCSWHEVYAMPVVEFLNGIAYRIDRNERERQAIERYKKTH